MKNNIWFHRAMVSTQDFESCDPSKPENFSILRNTLNFCWYYDT